MAAYNLEHYVTFAGAKSRWFISKHLKNYSLIINSSSLDIFSLTIEIEMLARILILIDNKCAMELTENDRFSVFYTKNNYLSMAYVIERLINLSGEEVKNRTEEFYDLACLNFNIQKTSKVYLENYI